LIFLTKVIKPPYFTKLTLDLNFTTRDLFFHSLFDLPNKDSSIQILLDCLELSIIIKLWSSLLTEKHVILLGIRGMLYPACSALLALIFPLKWMHTYIPILPDSFSLEFLESPTPYLIGVPKERGVDFQELCNEYPYHVICDLNTSQISKVDITPLPEQDEIKLRTKVRFLRFPKLDVIENLSDEQEIESIADVNPEESFPTNIQNIFFRIFKDNFKEFDKFLDKKNRFSQNDFLENLETTQSKKFWEEVVNTQAFANFILGYKYLDDENTVRFKNMEKLIDNRYNEYKANKSYCVKFTLPNSIEYILSIIDEKINLLLTKKGINIDLINTFLKTGKYTEKNEKEMEDEDEERDAHIEENICSFSILENLENWKEENKNQFEEEVIRLIELKSKLIFLNLNYSRIADEINIMKKNGLLERQNVLKHVGVTELSNTYSTSYPLSFTGSGAHTPTSSEEVTIKHNSNPNQLETRDLSLCPPTSNANSTDNLRAEVKLAVHRWSNLILGFSNPKNSKVGRFTLNHNQEKPENVKNPFNLASNDKETDFSVYGENGLLCFMKEIFSVMDSKEINKMSLKSLINDEISSFIELNEKIIKFKFCACAETGSINSKYNDFNCNSNSKNPSLIGAATSFKSKNQLRKDLRGESGAKLENIKNYHSKISQASQASSSVAENESDNIIVKKESTFYFNNQQKEKILNLSENGGNGGNDLIFTNEKNNEKYNNIEKEKLYSSVIEVPKSEMAQYYSYLAFIFEEFSPENSEFIFNLYHMSCFQDKNNFPKLAFYKFITNLDYKIVKSLKDSCILETVSIFSFSLRW